jgi:acyl-coenzyme A thioesterase PaaI-like protein
MRFYPPLFFQRVVPLYIAPDYSVAHIKVKRSLLTLNLNGSFFGGTIMGAIDPWYGVLIAQKAAHAGIPVEVWVQEMRVWEADARDLIKVGPASMWGNRR